MSEEVFQLKVVTPAGLALEDEASQVTLPSSQGEMGVLPRHCKYTGLLGTGLLEYYSVKEKKAIRLVIAKGFCNFIDDGLVILADSVVRQEDVAGESYSESRAELTKSLEGGNTLDPEWQFAKDELDKIEAIDRLVSH